MAKKKAGQGIFGRHAKSSAAIVTIAVHVAIALVAGLVVAVKVVVKPEPEFKAPVVKRPKMRLKKLQVPVTVKRKKPKPKLRRTVVVKNPPKMPDIKMPELQGVKGGIGTSGQGNGIGLGSGIGFAMPEIKIMGVKTKGEKVFIILDCSKYILNDGMGGVPAYTLIKEELVNVLSTLPPTLLFNVAIVDEAEAQVYFPNLVPATQTNVQKIKKWFEPLNRFEPGKGNVIGLRSMRSGKDVVRLDKTTYDKLPYLETVQSPRAWALATMEAMSQNADAIFVLSGWWGWNGHKIGQKELDPKEVERWNEAKKIASAKLAKENERRKRSGQAPRVVANSHDLVRVYFPDLPDPGGGFGGAIHYWYKPEDLVDAFNIHRKEVGGSVKQKVTAGVQRRRKKKNAYTINVIHFIKKDEENPDPRFKKLASETGGKYRTIEGMDEIESAVTKTSATDFEAQLEAKKAAEGPKLEEY